MDSWEKYIYIYIYIYIYKQNALECFDIKKTYDS